MSLKGHLSQTKVPFSWEKEPGVFKEMTQKDDHSSHDTDSEYDQIKQLSVSPSRRDIIKGNFVHDAQLLPLPPCGLFPPQRSSSKKGLKKQDDPFFTAYRECTKSINRGSKDDEGAHGISKYMSIFSCKHSCSVRDDSMIISKNSILSKSQRERRNIQKG